MPEASVLPAETARGIARRQIAELTRRPTLVFFYSPRSGHCRRVEGFLAQVLQRGHNHDTFTLHRIDSELKPELAERLGVGEPPSLVVVEGNRVRARLEQPRGCIAIRALLAPWLR